MIHSKDLSFTYPGSTQTLSFPDLELEAGDQALVLGSSGCGKSTLLGLWAGLFSPNKGSIQVFDQKIEALSSSQRDRWRAKNVGIVYQSPRLIASQSVINNIALQSKISGDSIAKTEILSSMKALGIDHLAQRSPNECSIGEQQRVGILRALIHKPQLILADEPTSALDRHNALAVANLLQEQAKKYKATLIIVTHDDRLKPLFQRTISLTTS